MLGMRHDAFRTARLLLPVLAFAHTVSLAAPARPKVAWVLSGGGARGAAHIGALMELEDAGIPVDVVVGTSFGALTGGLYSAGYSPEDLASIVTSIDWDRLLDDRPDRRLVNFNGKKRLDRNLLQLQFELLDLQLPTGLQAGQRIRQLLDRLSAVPSAEASNDFDRLRIPFRCVAADLISGKPVIFKSGSLGTALRASMAVPGVITPVEFGDTLLVDGGVVDNLPVRPALDWGADVVIAIDVTTPLRSKKDQFRSLIDVLDQTIGLRIEQDMERSRKKADIVVRPELEGFTVASFSQVSEMIPRGREAIRGRLDEIRSILRSRGIPLGTASKSSRILAAEKFDAETGGFPEEEVVVDAVEITGNSTYSDDTVLRHTRGAGQSGPTTIQQIDQDVSSVYGSGLFRTANFQLRNSPQGNRVLSLEVDEASPNSLGLGLRYDKDYRFTGAFELASRRPFGLGLDFFSEALIGNVMQFDFGADSGSLSGHRAFLAGRFRFRSFDRLTFTDQRPSGDFQDQRWGGEFSLNRLLSDSGRLEAGYRFERVEIDRLPEGRFQDGAENLAGLHAGFFWDTFDRSAFAETGLQSALTVDWMERDLGGDFSFLRLGAEIERRLPMGERGNLGLGGSWKLIKGGAPFYDLLYTGGRHYFDFSSDRFIGLRRDQLASKHRLVFDLSYRQRIFRSQLGAIKSAYLELEYNLGFFGKDEFTRSLGGPLHGIGFGASFDLRFLGPVRVLLGKAEDTDWNSSFSLGYRF